MGAVEAVLTTQMTDCPLPFHPMDLEDFNLIVNSVSTPDLPLLLLSNEWEPAYPCQQNYNAYSFYSFPQSAIISLYLS